jgi:hypothetical protein
MNLILQNGLQNADRRRSRGNDDQSEINPIRRD